MVETTANNIGSANEYGIFQRNRRALAQLIARLGSAVRRLGLEARVQELASLQERLESDCFKVMVLGEFKRGKSTFINALLGEEVLPSSAIPCTAVINEVKWGEQQRAILHFRHPLPKPLAVTVPPEVQAQIERHADVPIPPLEVPIRNLDSYVAIPEPEKDQAESVAESPYSKVEIFWPLEMCHNGIEIIDSPGLNENVTRAKVTTDYVNRVDAILFVMSCSALAAESELRVIDNDLRGVGHEYLFFICNRFDEVKESDRPRLKEYGRRKLMERTELREQGIFFLSALKALEGRLKNDPALVAQSGMEELEKALTRFLTHDRGKVKLLQPAREMLYALDESRNKILPTQRAMLDETLAALESKLEQMRPHLKDAERSRDQIVESLQHHRRALRSEVRLEFEKFLRGVADELENWIQELPLENQIKLWSFKQKEQVEAVQNEICSKISARFEAATLEWRTATLEPLIEAKLEAMKTTAESKVEDFRVRIDDARSIFFRLDQQSIDGELKNPSTGERVVAVLGGILLHNPTLIFHGSRFGFKGLSLSIAAQFVGVSICLLFNIFNPVALFAVITGSGFLASLLQAGRLNEAAKKEIARMIVSQFRADLTKAAETVGAEVYQQMEELVTLVKTNLDREIQVLREQVDSVLSAKREGEAQVQAKRRTLGELEIELRDVDTAVKDLIFAVAGR